MENLETKTDAFIAGAEWQQQNSYTKEEMLKAIEISRVFYKTTEDNGYDEFKYTPTEIIEQFIKTTIREFLNESTNDDNIIFVRTKNFDNTGTLNKLPYDGIQCWAIYENDLDKYIVELELWGGKKKNVEIINPSGHDIFALNYPMTHKYVMGETDEIPELIPFNKNEHIMRYIKQSGKSMLDYVSELGMGKMCYQILLK